MPWQNRVTQEASSRFNNRGSDIHRSARSITQPFDIITASMQA